jgi:hypothetical protein
VAALKCPHGRFPHACSPCLRAPDPRYPANVWITLGDAFHSEPLCEGIRRYQAMNLRQRKNVHDPRQVTQGEARFTHGKSPCTYCFPE